MVRTLATGVIEPSIMPTQGSSRSPKYQTFRSAPSMAPRLSTIFCVLGSMHLQPELCPSNNLIPDRGRLGNCSSVETSPGPVVDSGARSIFAEYGGFGRLITPLT